MGIIEKLKLAIKDIDITKVGYYDNDYKELSAIINDALSDDNKEENAKEIVNNLDFILSITNHFNNEWIINPQLLKQEHYVTKIIDNIDNFKYKEKTSLLLFGKLRHHLTEKQTLELYTPIVYKKMFECNLEEIEYQSIFRNLFETDQRLFIDELVKSNLKIDFSRYPIFPNNLDLIASNVEYLSEATDDLYYLRKMIIDGQKNDESIDKINNYIDTHKDKAIESLLNHCLILKNPTIREVVRLVILDVLDNEKVKLSDITTGKGAFSTIIIIGDKVIKVGTVRANKKFPNNPYVIKPLLRKTLETIGSECFVEVTERAESFSKDAYKDNPELTEELYELYKKIRDSGLIWTDVRMDNVGRLLKDNDKIYWKDPIEPSDEILEYTGRIDSEPLKKGELVILDADHIHRETDENIEFPVSAFRELFEARYQKEKESSKRKGFSTLKLLTAISISTILIVGMFITYMFMQ